GRVREGVGQGAAPRAGEHGRPLPRAVTVVLVRHGETEWSRDGRHTGRTDVPLTTVGEAQAAAVGAGLAGRSFALVVTSPRARAIETCRLAGLAGGVDDDLAEWDYGAYEGLTSEALHAARPGWWLWKDGCPSGESPAQDSARADRAIARLRAVDGDVGVFSPAHFLRVLGARWVGRPVAVFSHGRFRRVRGARWVGQPVAFGASLLLGTAGVCELGYEHDVPGLE